MKTELLIIGSGPAGYTAAIYASRAYLKTTLITGLNEGGQLVKSFNIENWPGEYKGINGYKLMMKFKKQVIKFKTNIIYDQIIKTKLNNQSLTIIGEKKVYFPKTVIIATGSSPKILNLPNIKDLYGNGISTCATCDGYFYKNKNIAIIGGGNSAIEETLFLSKKVKKIFLIHRREKLTAEKILIKKLTTKIKQNKIILLTNYYLININKNKNSNSIKSIDIKSTITNHIKNIKIDGLFIYIGYKPNTKIFKKQILLDEKGYIITNYKKNIFKTMTNINGVFAAGDVTDKIYRQAITSSSSGCKAAIDVKKYLENLRN